MRSFFRNKSGNFGVTTVVLAVPLLIGVGLSVDFARYTSLHNSLQNTTDAVALSLAASKERNQEKLEEVAANDLAVQGNIARQAPNYSVVSVEADDDRVTVELAASIRATFMTLGGQDWLRTSTRAVAERAVTGGLEMAMVLDNTYSMEEADSSGVKKINALKTAANVLVDELMKDNDGAVKMALVPYADYVNVGVGNRNQSWMSVPADYHRAAQKSGCTTTTESYCKKYPQKTCTTNNDGVITTSSCNDTSQACLETGTRNKETCEVNISAASYTFYGCAGSRVVSAKATTTDEITPRYPGFTDTAIRCPVPITPLTTDKTAVKNAIAAMVHVRGTYYKPLTYIPSGLTWGQNVLSNVEPFIQGGAYDSKNQKPRKALVLMTDGENTLTLKTTGSANATTGNAVVGTHVGFSGNATQIAAQKQATKDQTLALCTAMKNNKIEIFSVAFMVDDADAIAVMRGCSTNPDTHYFDASDADKLAAAFGQIGNSLRVVRLAR